MQGTRDCCLKRVTPLPKQQSLEREQLPSSFQASFELDKRFFQNGGSIGLEAANGCHLVSLSSRAH